MWGHKKITQDELYLEQGDEIVTKKFRYVDPKMSERDKIVRLSEISDEFKQQLEEHRGINSKGIRKPEIIEILRP
jgi:hypothetical protein